MHLLGIWDEMWIEYVHEIAWVCACVCLCVRVFPAPTELKEFSIVYYYSISTICCLMRSGYRFKNQWHVKVYIFRSCIFVCFEESSSVFVRLWSWCVELYRGVVCRPICSACRDTWSNVKTTSENMYSSMQCETDEHCLKSTNKKISFLSVQKTFILIPKGIRLLLLHSSWELNDVKNIPLSGF